MKTSAGCYKLLPEQSTFDEATAKCKEEVQHLIYTILNILKFNKESHQSMFFKVFKELKNVSKILVGTKV